MPFGAWWLRLALARGRGGLRRNAPRRRWRGPLEISLQWWCVRKFGAAFWRVPLPSGRGAFPHLRSNQDLVFVCIDAKEFRDGEKLKAKDF